MQYLLTQEEFDKVIPAEVVEPYVKALADYYRRKDEHLLKCLQAYSMADLQFSVRNPFAAPVERHRREWTEKPPDPKDFVKKP